MSATDVLRVERRDDGVAVITIDVPGESQNTLKAEFVEQLGTIFDDLGKDRALKGVIFISGKPGSFIAGADIHMLAACQSAQQASELSRQGQALCYRVAAFKAPIVAAIDGACLGGGLELALACQGRICSDSDTTRLGLPEVRLGLLPGSGGTQRLPRLIAISKALDLMLTGRHLRPGPAKRLGLVDDVVPATILLSAALKRLHELQKGAQKTQIGILKKLFRWGLEKIPKAREFYFQQARKQALAKSKGHYPAPERIIDCVETGIAQGFQAGLQVESRHFGELAMTPEAEQLMNLYFATTEMKKAADGDATPREVDRIGVLGAGLMGAGISYVSSRAGLQVRLKDKDNDALKRGLQYAHKRIQERLKRRALSTYEAAQQLRRVTPTLDYSGFRNVDLVIEAVFEDAALKRRMVEDIEQHCRADTIFASNTSSIPIADIALEAERPANIVGMHYFSPVEKMPLLEVIAAQATAPEVVATAVAVGRRQGKTVITVKDGAGFYVNRILAPYINEAMRLLEEGVAIEVIDNAMVDFGFPVGPFTLLDEVGIDVGAKVGPVLHDAFGERMKPARAAEALLAKGRTGKKSGKGFYQYGGKKRVDPGVYALLGVQPRLSMEADKISQRCVLALVNEAARCLHENVIHGARDGDVGAVFGIGFPPFRGGPFRYADRLGIDGLVATLSDYRHRLGERFAPAELLVEMAEQRRRFY